MDGKDFHGVYGNFDNGRAPRSFFSPRALKFPLYELHMKISENGTVHFTVFSVSQTEGTNK